VVGPLHVQRVHRPVPHALAPHRDVAPVAVLPLCAFDDPVVDVGDVGDVGDVVARPGQVPPQHVEHEREPSVTQVRRADTSGASSRQPTPPRAPGAHWGVSDVWRSAVRTHTYIDTFPGSRASKGTPPPLAVSNSRNMSKEYGVGRRPTP